MGILYNRLSSKFTLLPFSDQTKITTYATVDNFSDNRSWGDGIAPITGSWEKSNFDGGYVTSTYSQSFNTIDNASVLGTAFTIYEVLFHNNATAPEFYADNPNITIYRGAQSTGFINDELFSPRYDAEHLWYYENISNSAPGWDSNIYCNLPSMHNVHITAVAYEFFASTKSFSAYERCNDTTWSGSWSQPQSARGLDINEIRFAGRYQNQRCYKFIAVVAEKESAEVIANNVALLKSYFRVEY